MTHEDFETIAALDAVGAATAEEAAELRRHAGECIPCRRAMQEYAEAATLLARDLDPVAPPAEVRASLMDSVRAGGTGTANNVTRMTWLAAAAAVLFAVVGLWQASNVRRLNEDNEHLLKERVMLRQQADTLSAELEALAAHDTRQIALTGQVIAPSASAKVFLEPSRQRAVVFFHNLPVNGKDKSYQLWLIRADQPKPVSAGVFDAARNGRASISIENLPISTEIKGLAVTLEPRGGVQQPTNTDFIVSGNVS
jgi:anti-sigma-K factor RskA